MANPVSPGGKLPPSRGTGLAAFADAAGISNRTRTQAEGMLSDDAYDAYGNIGGLSVEDTSLPLGSQIEADTQRNIFNGTWSPKYGEDEFGKFLNSIDPSYAKARYDLQDQGIHIVANSYYYTNYTNPDGSDRTDYNRGDALERAGGTGMRAAQLQDIPTSSSNYKRPRTVAAGYDANTQILTVVFRDGTFWNYYDISPGIWIIFHSSLSKGPLINSNEQNKHGDGLILRECSSHGPADLSNLTPQAQEFLYKVARTSQIYYASRTRYAPKKGNPRGAIEGYVPQNAGSGQKYKEAQKRARAKLGKNKATGGRPKK
jgi:hypothetical protein